MGARVGGCRFLYTTFKLSHTASHKPASATLIIWAHKKSLFEQPNNRRVLSHPSRPRHWKLKSISRSPSCRSQSLSEIFFLVRTAQTHTPTGAWWHAHTLTVPCARMVRVAHRVVMCIRSSSFCGPLPACKTPCELNYLNWKLMYHWKIDWKRVLKEAVDCGFEDEKRTLI